MLGTALLRVSEADSKVLLGTVFSFVANASVERFGDCTSLAIAECWSRAELNFGKLRNDAAAGFFVPGYSLQAGISYADHVANPVAYFAQASFVRIHVLSGL